MNKVHYLIVFSAGLILLLALFLVERQIPFTRTQPRSDAAWSRYTDSNFSIAYPGDWTKEGPSQYNYISRPQANKSRLGPIYIFKLYVGDDFAILSPRIEITVDEVGNSQEANLISSITAQLKGSYEISASELDGVEAKRFDISDSNQIATRLLAFHKGKVYQISITGGSGQNEAIVNQVLKTFRFR